MKSGAEWVVSSSGIIARPPAIQRATNRLRVERDAGRAKGWEDQIVMLPAYAASVESDPIDMANTGSRLR